MTTHHYALIDARVVDVVAGAVREELAVVVKDGRINRLCPLEEVESEVERRSLGGRYLMPGLIDCHTHVFIGQFNDNNSVLPSEMTARSGQQLAEMLRRGFTTVRDAGGADPGHRTAVEKGLFSGPRMFVSGKILSQTGGHGDHRGKADFCTCASMIGGTSVIADGIDEVRKAVRENVRQGVDQIKIMAGGGVSSPGDKLIHPQYSLEEIAVIVEEAERCGRYVMSHVYSDIGIQRAVTAGVRSIEHGNFLSDDTAKMMVEKEAHLVPTLITYEADGKHGMSFGWSRENQAKNAEVLDHGLTSLEIATRHGVNIGYGTDLCWSPKTYQADGLLIHEKVCGSADALRHATINNAKIVRMEGEIGVVAPGAIADLLVVDANPLDGVACLSQTDNMVVGVIQNGIPVRDDLEVLGQAIVR